MLKEAIIDKKKTDYDPSKNHAVKTPPSVQIKRDEANNKIKPYKWEHISCVYRGIEIFLSME